MAITTIPSTNMNLPVPIPGIDPGPQYAIDLNDCLTILDQHNHTPGSGVLITPAAININTTLSMGNNDLTDISRLGFIPQSPSVLSSLLYENGVDLYFNDGLGNVIRITQGGSVAGASGTITGLPSGTASASFASGVFTFQASTNTGANIDGASFIFRNNSANSKGLTLSPPNAMANDYTLVLPAIPATSGAVLTLDTSGNITAAAGADYILPAGIIQAYGGTSVPAGWLLCDGSAVLRGAYARLFTAISTAYGNGNGSSTFNVPDLRGLFLRGTDNMGTGAAGRDPDASSRTALISGGNTGDNVGSYEPDEFASHTHAAPTANRATALDGSSNWAGGNTTTSGAVNGTGGAGGSETRPINIYVNYIIKT